MEEYWEPAQDICCEIIIFKDDVEMTRVKLQNTAASVLDFHLDWPSMYDYSIFVCKGRKLVELDLLDWLHYNDSDEPVLEIDKYEWSTFSVDFDSCEICHTLESDDRLELLEREHVDSYHLESLLFKVKFSEDKTQILRLENVSMQFRRTFTQKHDDCPRYSFLPTCAINIAKQKVDLFTRPSLNTWAMIAKRLGVPKDIRLLISKLVWEISITSGHFVIEFESALHFVTSGSNVGVHVMGGAVEIYCHYCVNVGVDTMSDLEKKRICRFLDLYEEETRGEVGQGGSYEVRHPKFGLIYTSYWNSERSDYDKKFVGRAIYVF